MFKSILALGIRSSAVYSVSVADGAVTEVYTGQPGVSPDGIVLGGREAYWTTMGRPTRDPQKQGEAGLDYTARNGGIHAIGLDGTGRRDITAPGAITTGKQLAFDGADTLYWGDREGNRVSRVKVDGSGLTDLVVNAPQADGLGQCVGVAVDTARGHLYWTQKGPSKGGLGRIFRAGLEIPEGQTAANRSDIETLWDRLPEPIDLEIVGDRLYWTDRGAAPDGNSLNHAPLPAPGARGAEPEILARGFQEAIGLAVDAAAGLAFVSDLGGRILRVRLQDGTVDVLADLGTPLSGIAGSTASIPAEEKQP